MSCTCCNQTYEESLAAATAGAAALDHHFGEPTWDERVDVDTLDLVSIHECVLGQLFGSFNHAPARLIAEEGFYGWVHDEAWRDLIASRQAVRQPAPVKAEVDGELVGI